MWRTAPLSRTRADAGVHRWLQPGGRPRLAAVWKSLSSLTDWCAKYLSTLNVATCNLVGWNHCSEGQLSEKEWNEDSTVFPFFFFPLTLLILIFLGSILKPRRSKIKKIKILRLTSSTWQKSALNFSMCQDFVGNAAEDCKEGRSELEHSLERVPAIYHGPSLFLTCSPWGLCFAAGFSCVSDTYSSAGSHSLP